MVYAKSSADIDDYVRIIYRRQMSYSLMVWAEVSKPWKSPLTLVEQGVEIKNLYIKDLLVDGAPSHWCKKLRGLVKTSFLRFWSKDMWSPA